MGQQRKKEMRQEIKRVLANLDKRWQAVAHAEVCRRIAHIVEEEGAITDVLAWVPSFPGEVDLAEIIAEMLKTRRVYLPRVIGPGEMSFVRVAADWSSHLERGEHGVLQPRRDYGELLGEIDEGRLLVLVPGVAFDPRGARLGRGGGYYDRFLERINHTNALTVGVCWSVQLVPEVPVDPHDVHVNWICHEREAIKISSELK